MVTVSKEHFNILVQHSLRYCMGRMTYAPYEFQCIFDKHFDDLTDRTLQILLEDINKCHNFGMDFDEAMWMKVKERIEKRLVGVTDV